MNRVSALIAMIACTQAIQVHLESETEFGDLFDSIADSVSKTAKSAANAVDRVGDAVLNPGPVTGCPPSFFSPDATG